MGTEPPEPARAKLLLAFAAFYVLRHSSVRERSRAARDLREYDVTKNEAIGEYVRVWRPSGVAGVELYTARLLSHTFGKHFHEEYTIGLNDAGAGSFWCRGANRTAGPRSLNLLAPGEVHTGAAAGEEWTYRNLYVAASVVEDLARQSDWPPGCPPSFPQPVAVDDRVWSAVDRLFRVLGTRHSRLESEGTAVESLRLVFERFGGRPPGRVAGQSPAVARAREFLEDRLCDDVSLRELSGAAGVSPNYLVRCFRRELGLPPHAYQLQVRLQRAKSALRSGAPLADVAIRHGFFDQSHFHRHFRRAFGVTPGRYREGYSVQDD